MLSARRSISPPLIEKINSKRWKHRVILCSIVLYNKDQKNAIEKINKSEEIYKELNESILKARTKEKEAKDKKK